MRLAGERIELNSPDVAHGRGVWTVFQELTLLPWMTVAENLLIRHEPRGALGLIDRARMAQEADAILSRLGIHHIDPRKLVEDLSLAQRQIVEIVRVIVQDPDILLLDEPTSSLGENEVEWLFGLIRDLRARNKCIIFTSHRWNEITDIADRITIFRNGSDLGTFTEIDESEAVTLMTGQQVDAFYPAAAGAGGRAAAARGAGPERSGHLRHIDDASCRREILGVGGLAGHGHRELFFSLFGAESTTDGEIWSTGSKVRIKSPARCGPLGIALVPEDRKTEGLLLPMSVGINLTLAVLPQISVLGVIRGGRESAAWRTTWSRGSRSGRPACATPSGNLAAATSRRCFSRDGCSPIRVSCSSTT